jgi:hypothetical protein
MPLRLDHTAVAAQVPALLRTLAGPAAVPHPEQLAAIQAVVAGRRRVLVVQRTGWGKSAVYFLATRLLRDAGAGPTFLISPLLALMRDQAAAAERVGVRAASINSTNVRDWRAIEDQIAADQVDLLLVSPERLNNPGFAARVLPLLTRQAGLVGVPVRSVSPAANEHEQAGFRRQVADDVVALLGVGEGQAGVAGLTRHLSCQTCTSLPTVTAPRSCDTRYPPFCSPRLRLDRGSAAARIRLICERIRR